MGRVAAGAPLLAVEHIESRYRVEGALFSPPADYLLRVRGESMKDAGILDGDLVAVHKTSDARSGQIVVARIGGAGGDEFAIVVPEIDGVEEAELVTTKVLEALEPPFELGGLALHVDASVGIAMAPAHGDDAAVLLQRADVAMYRAKGLVEGYAVYATDTDENRLQRLALMTELRRAVDEGELNSSFLMVGLRIRRLTTFR